MRRVPRTDVIALVVPAQVDVEATDGTALADALSNVAVDQIGKQFAAQPEQPYILEFGEFTWLITDDAADAATFQPIHNCGACVAGIDQAVAFLRENPGRYVAFGNLTYTEGWL